VGGRGSGRRCGKDPMEEGVGVVGYSSLGLTDKNKVAPVMVHTWAQVMSQ
jgi:hypothetical protein